MAAIPPWLDGPASRRGSSAFSPSYAAVISPTLTWNTFLGTDYHRPGPRRGHRQLRQRLLRRVQRRRLGAPVNGFAGNTDAFVAKLNGSGHLVWNTFLGSPTGDDWAYGIAVDGNGNARVAGYSTEGWGLSPVNGYAGGEDAFVARLDTNGNRLWHTFAGGSGNDRGYGIALDGSGNGYVTGYSGSGTGWSGTPVNGHAGSDDAFAVKLNASGSRQWYTFMGSSSGDYGQAIAVDATANAHVTGYSNADWGSQTIVRWVAGKDAFVARLNSSGGQVWNTFLGGNGNEQGNAIALDGSGGVYLSGDSTATWGSPKRVFSAGSDAFAAKLSSAGQLQWNTFLGSANNEYGLGVAADGAGNSYLTGYGKAPWGSPVEPFTFHAGEDIIVAKLDAGGNSEVEHVPGVHQQRAGQGTRGGRRGQRLRGRLWQPHLGHPHQQFRGHTGCRRRQALRRSHRTGQRHPRRPDDRLDQHQLRVHRHGRPLCRFATHHIHLVGDPEIAGNARRRLH